MKSWLTPTSGNDQKTNKFWRYIYIYIYAVSYLCAACCLAGSELLLCLSQCTWKCTLPNSFSTLEIRSGVCIQVYVFLATQMYVSARVCFVWFRAKCTDAARAYLEQVKQRGDSACIFLGKFRFHTTWVLLQVQTETWTVRQAYRF